jgi:predicted nucleic acid-binding protein
VVTYILDSSAILRFTDSEAGADQVQRILEQFLDGRALVATSALCWGEVAGRLHKLRGSAVMAGVLQRLAGMGIEIVPVTSEQAVSAALIRADYTIPYIEAFGVVLALAGNHVFVTADSALSPAAKIANIEFLPPK